MTGKKRPLWTCPKCGHRFVTRNLWHSCSNHRLADHFKGKDPIVRELFNHFRALVREHGPVTVIAQKTRIVFMTRVRFGGAVTHQQSIDIGLWLTQRVTHPCLTRIETFGPNSYGHHFRFTRLEDMDEAFAALIPEAYAVGRQEHLLDRARRKTQRPAS
jgi:hypothetical protein